MTNRISRRAMACALYTSVATCGLTAQPAHAQQMQSQKFRQVDANGVDLTWGDYITSFVEGSIGSGNAELKLVRTAPWRDGAYDNNSNNQIWDHVWLDQVPLFGGGTRINIHTGSTFEQFDTLGTLPSGSSLSGGPDNFQYRTADGTTITFTDPTGGTQPSSQYCNGAQTQCILVPTSIRSPDGRTLTLSWDVNRYTLSDGDGDGVPDESFDTRIASVANSFGYRIAFTYASNTGSSTSPAAGAWHKRTAARFYNDNVSTTAVQASTAYSYPASNVTEVTDTGGRVWRFTGTGDRITAIRRPGAASDTTVVGYNGVTGIVSSVTRDGVATSYSRVVSGSTATMTVTDALAHSSVITSDLNVGRPTAIQDELNRTTGFQYDSSGRLTRVTQPEGNYVQLTYDARGNVTEQRQVAKAGSGLADIVATAAYPASCTNTVTCNKPTSTTDARGNVTDYTYDSTHGGVLTVTAPAATTGGVRPQVRNSYTLLNGEYQLTGISACQTTASCTGTADEVRATLGYDIAGNVTSIARGNGSGTLTAISSMTYDAIGNVLTVDGPLGGTADTTRYRYNAARQRVGVVGPDPDGSGSLKNRAVRTTYNASSGLVTKQERGTTGGQGDNAWSNFTPAEAVEVAYDANARVSTQTLSNGATQYALTQVSYDALGRTDCVAQRMNPAAYGALPASACTLGTEGSFGPDRIQQTVYDAASDDCLEW
jgi:YD repeat-containing protein